MALILSAQSRRRKTVRRLAVSSHTNIEQARMTNRLSAPLDPSNYLDRVLKPLAADAGIRDLTYQAMRRTCATYFRDQKKAQRQLRHATPVVTAKHYIQNIPSEHRQALERLDAELCRPKKPKLVTMKKRV
jgi:integrase